MLTVILAGGASRRMGRDKPALPWEGSTLLQSLLRRYATLGPAAVSVDRPGRFDVSGAIELVDRFPGAGPLNGLVAAFESTGAAELFLTAVDLPFGDPALALRLADLRGDADAAVLRRGVKGAEPLFAVYGSGCLAPARALLDSGEGSFRALFRTVRLRWVLPEELPEFDLDRILSNVNTQEDYDKCLKRL